MTTRAHRLSIVVASLLTACQPADSSVPAIPSSADSSAATACRDDLIRFAKQSGEDGVSVFRLFRTYPPQPEESKSSLVAPEKLSIVPQLGISSACHEDAARHLSAAETRYFSKISSGNFKPLMVVRTGDRYLLGLLHSGFVEGDGEGEELAVSFVIYDMGGRSVGVLPRASSWRSYEGSELIQEACVTEQGVTMREIVVYPEEQNHSGTVIRYEPPEVQGLTFYSLSKRTAPLIVKFDCSSFPGQQRGHYRQSSGLYSSKGGAVTRAELPANVRDKYNLGLREGYRG